MILKDVVTLYTSYWMIVFGVLLMIIILVTPNGIMGLLEQITLFVKDKLKAVKQAR